MTTLTNLVSSFAMGTTILLGQQIGSGSKKEGGRTVGTSIVMFGVIAVILSIIIKFLIYSFTNFFLTFKSFTCFSNN